VIQVVHFQILQMSEMWMFLIPVRLIEASAYINTYHAYISRVAMIQNVYEAVLHQRS
jgi:hypothetical protein